MVVYPGAKPDAYYTVVMVDPDADMNGSFPFATAPGAHAPVRHWILGNLLGSALAVGEMSGAVEVSPFHGPSPPAGSHRCECQAPARAQRCGRPANGPTALGRSACSECRNADGQFLFEQPSRLNFNLFPANASIVQWDYAGFVKEYSLGEPVATNWHLTLHTSGNSSAPAVQRKAP
eukprot:290701-Prymnesium_polylepis.2